MEPAVSSSLLILGLGNLLCGDDGFGPAVVAALLDAYAAPPGVEVLDGGTLGLSLLPVFEDVEHVILVDAVRVDAAVGTLVRLDGDEVGPAVATRLSPHQVGVSDVLALARLRGRFPSRLILLGIVPERLAEEIGLSAVVATQVPVCVRRIAAVAADWGFPLLPRRDCAPEPANGPSVVPGITADPISRASKE